MTCASTFIASVSSSSSASARPVQAASAAGDGDVHRRRSGDAGADRRLGPRAHVDAARAEMPDQPGDAAAADRRRARRDRAASTLLAGVVGDEHDAVVAARGQRAVRAQAERRVDRLRAFVKEVERPDVERAAGEIDPRRRGGVDAHARIIMAGECRFGSFGVTSAGWPSSASPATAVPDDLRRLVAEFDLGGVIYFARNIVEPAQVAELSREVAALARDWPFWISVDQEGGRVARLKSPFTEWPPAITLGRSGDEALAARFARGAGGRAARRRHQPRLRAGARRPHQSGQPGDRRPRAVRATPTTSRGSARRSSAALQAGGVAACGKHFPGHGDTSVDSHEALPVVEHDRAAARRGRARAVPRARSPAGVATIMTAHVLVPALDERPAGVVFAARSSTDLLKETLGFGGVVISDDLGHEGGQRRRRRCRTRRVAAIAAGCDAVLLCNSTTGRAGGRRSRPSSAPPSPARSPQNAHRRCARAAAAR